MGRGGSPDARRDTMTMSPYGVFLGEKDKFVTLEMGDTASVVRTWSFVIESAYRSGPELEIEEP